MLIAERAREREGDLALSPLRLVVDRLVDVLGVQESGEEERERRHRERARGGGEPPSSSVGEPSGPRGPTSPALSLSTAIRTEVDEGCHVLGPESLGDHQRDREHGGLGDDVEA